MKTQVIGTILKEMGTVTQEQIDAAMHVQRVTDEVLGKILVQLNFVTTDELARAIASQYRLDYIDLNGYVPMRETLDLVDKEFALLNMVIPLKIEEGALVVATEWPDDDAIRDSLQESTGYPIRFAVSDSDTLAKYLQFYYEQSDYSVEQRIDEIMKMPADEIDAIDFVDVLINDAIKERATDIHIMPERFTSHIFYRIDGALKHAYSIPMSLYTTVANRIKVLARLDISQQLQPLNGDFAITFYQSSYNIRVSSIPTLNGENLALRLMPEHLKLYNLENLGFEPDIIENISNDLQKRNGIILIIGSSGSGKTTTLYAMLRKIDILKRNVISVEEPVEHLLPFVNQVQINRQIDYTFEKALHHIARQDPDVISIGEILDDETAKLTMRSSVTGHLILSTLSGGSAATAISRLRDFGINTYLLADGLLSVISQTLLRRLCNECKKEVAITKEALAAYFSESREEIFSLPEEMVKLYEPVGCQHCRESGYMGRVAVAEYFQVDDTIKDIIAHNKSSLELQRYLRSQGYTDIKSDALKKLLRGTTSLQEVMRMID